MSIQKTEAILLSRRDVRETSAIVLFYTESFGKIKGLLKGVRGPGAKCGLYLREFSKCDIVYYEKEKSDTYMITQCDVKEPYNAIADDFDKRLTTYYVLELIDKFTPLADKNADIYSLLVWILESIRAERSLETLLIIYQIKLLEYSGLLPQFGRCVHCSKEIVRDGSFSVRMAGLLCSHCRGADIQTITLSKGAMAYIHMIERQRPRVGFSPVIARDMAKEIKRLLSRFIEYHLGEHLKTQEVIQEIAEAEIIATA